jgi:hypothetical protein
LRIIWPNYFRSDLRVRKRAFDLNIPGDEAASVCFCFGVRESLDVYSNGLIGGFDLRWRRDEEPTASDAHVNTNQEPPEGIEAKLRQLLRLKEQKLITEEEYNPKRTERAHEGAGVKSRSCWKWIFILRSVILRSRNAASTLPISLNAS